MAAKHGRSKVRMQDAYSVDLGPQQPPIPNTTSPCLQNIYLRQQSHRPLLLSSKTDSSVLKQRKKRVGGGGARSGAWQCLRLLKITAVCFSLCPVLPPPLEVMHNLQQTQNRPLFKVDSPSALEQETAASPFRSTGCAEAAAPRFNRMEESGVFPWWD